MGKTQCNSNCESSEKQVLHATKNGKVEKKECERCPLLTRATYILESQVEKITWKAFLLSEQKRQQDEYVKYLEERLQDSEKRATDVIVTTMPSHHEEGETICTRESVACQTEQYRLTQKKPRGICPWCLKNLRLSRYPGHTRYCKVRLSTRNTCCECGGGKVTHRNCSEKFKVVCNLCENIFKKENWDKHSTKCEKNRFPFHCTCETVTQ